MLTVDDREQAVVHDERVLPFSASMLGIVHDATVRLRTRNVLCCFTRACSPYLTVRSLSVNQIAVVECSSVEPFLYSLSFSPY